MSTQSATYSPPTSPSSSFFDNSNEERSPKRKRENTEKKTGNWKRTCSSEKKKEAQIWENNFAINGEPFKVLKLAQGTSSSFFDNSNEEGFLKRRRENTGKKTGSWKRTGSSEKKKEAQIWDNNFAINGEQFKVLKLAQGKEHYTYEFIGKAKDLILPENTEKDKTESEKENDKTELENKNDKTESEKEYDKTEIEKTKNTITLDVFDLVLKVVQPNKNPFQSETFRQIDLEAHKQMVAKGIPIPICYVNPETFQDTCNPANGNFWIFKRMKAHVSCESWKEATDLSHLSEKDMNLFLFVKSYLTLGAHKHEDYINDFYPRNVMEDEYGCLYIIDIALPQPDEWIPNLFSYVLAWSNGCQWVYDELISEFPKEVKAEMNSRLEEKKLDSEGKFPLSKQTNVK